MKSKEFKEVNVRVAEDQPEYITLPAYFNPDEGSMTFCFELSEDEMNRIKATGEIWFKQFTGGKEMQAIYMSTNKEDLIKPL